MKRDALPATTPHLSYSRGWWACCGDGRCTYGASRPEAYLKWTIRWNGLGYDVIDRFSRQWKPLVRSN